MQARTIFFPFIPMPQRFDSASLQVRFEAQAQLLLAKPTTSLSWVQKTSCSCIEFRDWGALMCAESGRMDGIKDQGHDREDILGHTTAKHPTAFHFLCHRRQKLDAAHAPSSVRGPAGARSGLRASGDRAAVLPHIRRHGFPFSYGRRGQTRWNLCRL